MQYNGGKHRQSKYICPIINSFTKGEKDYYEPFVGGLNIAIHVKARNYFLSDINESIISMWNAALNGFIFPNEVSKEEFYEAKYLSNNDPIKAFILIGCSFGGWGRCYASGVNGNYAGTARRGIAKKIALCNNKKIRLHSCDYKQIDAIDSVIYCDPPYINTEKYKFNFNHEDFWNWCKLTAKDNIVLVSECTIPDNVNYELLWEREVTRTQGDVSKSRPKAIEKLVRVYA